MKLKMYQRVVVLQIGDQLGDNQSSAFAEQMATKLREANWQDTDECDTLQALFLSLNSNLRGVVVQQVLRDYSRFCAVAAAEHWPRAMQLVCFLPTTARHMFPGA